ncbi:MAG: hypothetical protein ACRDRJ_52165, partial [Streptosporangiaceae bacterium]
MPVAWKILLQLAARNIGQLTDIKLLRRARGVPRPGRPGSGSPEGARRKGLAGGEHGDGEQHRVVDEVREDGPHQAPVLLEG